MRILQHQLFLKQARRVQWLLVDAYVSLVTPRRPTTPLDGAYCNVLLRQFSSVQFSYVAVYVGSAGRRAEEVANRVRRERRGRKRQLCIETGRHNRRRRRTHCRSVRVDHSQKFRTAEINDYYGAVLPRRRPHHVLILSVCLSRAST